MADIYHAKSRLNTPVWGLLRLPNYRVRIFNFLHVYLNLCSNNSGLISISVAIVLLNRVAGTYKTWQQKKEHATIIQNT